MATLKQEQIEAKKQQLKQLAEEAKKLKDELVEAGAWPLDEDELDDVAGGRISRDSGNNSGNDSGYDSRTNLHDHYFI